MKLASLCMALCFVVPQSCFARYRPTSLVGLAGKAELIAVGTIVDTEPPPPNSGFDLFENDVSTIQLEIEDVIAGDVVIAADVTNNTTITVRAFRDWTCAKRWTKYKVGQKVLVFLRFDKSKKVWDIIGGGGEGESPVVGQIVYANFYIPEKMEEGGRLSFKRWHLQPVSYWLLRAAIQDLITTFRFPWRGDPGPLKDGTLSHHVQSERIAIRATEDLPRPAADGTPPDPTQSTRLKREAIIMAAFENRSPLHRFLAKTVVEERREIEK